MSIVLTNPEAYPKGDTFREGIIEAADIYYGLMEGMSGQQKIQLMKDLVKASDVAIAVFQPPSAPDRDDIQYTFYTVKGEDALRTSAGGYTMVGFPIPDPELASLLREICGDDAEVCDEPKKQAPITGPRPCTVGFPKEQRGRLIDSANDLSRIMLGMDRAAAQEYVRQEAAKVSVVVAIYPDPEAPPEHGGISFAVIKGLQLFKAAIGTDTNLKIMALALSDEQQAIAAEKNIGDERPLN